MPLLARKMESGLILGGIRWYIASILNKGRNEDGNGIRAWEEFFMAT